MIVLALLLCSCVRLDCVPTGRILWGDSVPTSMKSLIHSVDGGMAGVSCTWQVVDGHR